VDAGAWRRVSRWQRTRAGGSPAHVTVLRLVQTREGYASVDRLCGQGLLPVRWRANTRIKRVVPERASAFGHSWTAVGGAGKRWSLPKIRTSPEADDIGAIDALPLRHWGRQRQSRGDCGLPGQRLVGHCRRLRATRATAHGKLRRNWKDV